MDITIHNAQLADGNGQQAWMLAVEVDRLDGTGPQMVAVVLPADTIEWRAAEYGLDDHTDEELWNLVIRESLTPPAPYEDPTPIAYSDAPVEARRQRYLERHRGSQVKTRAKGQARPHVAPGQPLKVAGPTTRVLVDSDLADPIATMLKHTPRRDEHVAARRDIVEDTRARLADQRQQAAQPARADEIVLRRAHQIRQQKEPRSR